ncbi:MAG: threonine/serine exporter family protein, partial [Ornithinimicrobium sp.]
MPHEDPAPEDDARVRLLLAHLGAAMIATGQPVNEIEEELEEVGAHLGYPNAQVGAAPTGLMLSLRSGDPAAYESVTAKVRLDQASEVRRIRHQLVFAQLTVSDAFDQLSRLRAKPPLYQPWLTKVAWVFVAAGIGFILQPGWANVAAVVVCAIAVLGLNSLASRAEVMATLLPTIAAFVVTMIVFLAADMGWIEGPLRTVLPPIAALLPGALIVTGMSELAAGHMQAGASRLTYGVVQLGLFALGLIAATTVLQVPTAMMVNVRVEDIGWWAPIVGLLLIALGISLMESVPLSMSPWVLLVLVMAFAAQSLG